MNDRRVIIIGGGVAGLTAAADLAGPGLDVVLIEKSDVLGGHAGQYACKAAETCVRCGACMVDEKRKLAAENPRIQMLTGCRVEAADRSDRFRVTASGNGGSGVHEADALVLATGFQAYSPEDRPYGYGKFKNVVTNLELERMLRKENLPRRPSDGAFPERMAFIQCVGSRDARLKHLWCSQVCCASALRMARLIRFRRPETDIVFFYIDVQTFGADFDAFYGRVKTEIRMVREIPADFYPADDDRLRIPYFDAESGKEAETICDMAVLSVGMTPGPDNRDLAEKLGFSPAGTGFLEDPAAEGVFIAGAAGGPMSIPDAVRSAGETAARVRNYLSRL